MRSTKSAEREPRNDSVREAGRLTALDQKFSVKPFGRKRSGDPLMILRNRVGMFDPLLQRQEFLDALANLSAEEFPAAAALVRAGSDRDRMRMELSLLTYAWALRDGRAAVDWLKQSGVGNWNLGLAVNYSHDIREPESPMFAALTAWAITDPDAAIEFANARAADQEEDAATSASMVAVMNGIAGHDLEFAKELLVDGGYREVNDDLARVLVARHLELGDQETLDWIESIPSSGADTQEDLASLTVRAISDRDLEAATDWATQLGDFELRKDTVFSLYSYLKLSDSESLATWLRALPDSPEFQEIFYRHGESLAQYENPKDAEEWVGRITDTKKREQLQYVIEANLKQGGE